jgi:hypothetical protein
VISDSLSLLNSIGVATVESPVIVFKALPPRLAKITTSFRTEATYDFGRGKDSPAVFAKFRFHDSNIASARQKSKSSSSCPHSLKNRAALPLPASTLVRGPPKYSLLPVPTAPSPYPVILTCGSEPPDPLLSGNRANTSSLPSWIRLAGQRPRLGSCPPTPWVSPYSVYCP